MPKILDKKPETILNIVGTGPLLNTLIKQSEELD
jgi:hypothetical protein